MPSLSVIMPVYNGERFLEETVESVLNQTFTDFEFIVIDDGSTDDTLRILRDFEDERIKIIEQEHRGLTKSLNRGIKIAEGDYIGRMDCGDIADEERFEVEIDFLEREDDIYGVGSWAELIDEDGNSLGSRKYPVDFKEIKKVILRYNPFIHPSLTLESDIFQKVGLYDEDFKYAQDYDLMLRAVSKLKVTNIPRNLLKYRISEEAISLNQMKEQEFYAIKARIKALTKYGYPKWQFLYLSKPFISFLVPVQVKKFILDNILGYGGSVE